MIKGTSQNILCDKCSTIVTKEPHYEVLSKAGKKLHYCVMHYSEKTLHYDTTFVRALLSGYGYSVSFKPADRAIKCESKKGIESDSTWDLKFQKIKNHFGPRFSEVFHYTCTYHICFLIYLTDKYYKP